jgi:mono/diheme cytochrome c family protein
VKPFGRKARVAVAGVLMMLAAAAVAFGHGWMAPAGAAARRNPLPRDAAAIDRGRAVYAILCAECHGAEGRGDGPKAARTWPAPTDLTRIGSHSPGDIAWKIENGRGDMPAFKDKLAAADIWALTHWIQSLKR